MTTAILSSGTTTLDVILGAEAPRITGADATRTLAATLAVREAAATGCCVTL
jgi:hypothetical protein